MTKSASTLTIIQYRKSRYIRKRFDVTDMTIWRWVKQGILEEPIYINGHRYWTDEQLDKVESYTSEVA